MIPQQFVFISQQLFLKRKQLFFGKLLTLENGIYIWKQLECNLNPISFDYNDKFTCKFESPRRTLSALIERSPAMLTHCWTSTDDSFPPMYENQYYIQEF